VRPAGLALDTAVLGQLHELGLELGHPAHEATAVDLQLGLARASGPDAAGLLGQRDAPPPQPGKAVAEKGQLHLSLALEGVGILGEDVEDHRRAVDGGAAQDLLQIALLGRAQLVVEHHRVRVHLERQPA
jgi:hypothetical protein